MPTLIAPLFTASAALMLTILPTTAQAAGTEDGAALVAAENEIIDELAPWAGRTRTRRTSTPERLAMPMPTPHP